MQQLGSRAQTLRGWMPLGEYSNPLDSCGTAIFAHVHQQAVGNLILTLWKGAQVFMAEGSAVLCWYRSLGLHVFSIRHDLTEHSLNEPLTTQQRVENRTILRRLYSQQAAIERLMAFYSLAAGSD